MSNNESSDGHEVFRKAASVAEAGRMLQNFIGGERAAREAAASELSQAADSQGRASTSYRSFMMSEATASPTADAVTRNAAAANVFASVLVDTQVASVLIAAGQNLGEAGATPDPTLLEEALTNLEETTRSVNAAGGIQGRFGFSESGSADEANVEPSGTLEEALDRFRRQANETLSTLVSETQGVISKALETLRDNRITGKVWEGVSVIGRQLSDLPQFASVGRLIGQGAEILQNTVNSLVSWVGNDALTHFKEKISEFLKKVLNEDDIIKKSLEWVLGVDSTKASLAAALGVGGFEQGALDDGTGSLTRLSDSYKESMGFARSVVSALSLVGAGLLLIPAAGTKAALLIASANVLVLAVVILVGMDYADSGSVLRRVRGVGSIIGDLKAA